MKRLPKFDSAHGLVKGLWASALICAQAVTGSARAVDLTFEPTLSSQQRLSAKKLIWEDRDVNALDLSQGAGSADGSGRPMGPLKWIGASEDLDASTAQLSVMDKNGKKFLVRLQTDETQTENIASHFLHGLGYRGQEVYFVPRASQLEIEGLSEAAFKALRGAKRLVGYRASDGKFFVQADANFKLRDPSMLSGDERWSSADPSIPFAGSKYLSGLQILEVLLNRSDSRLGNSHIQYLKKADGTIEAWYAQTDSGLGRARSLPPQKGSPDFASSKMIARVREGMIDLHYFDRASAKAHRSSVRELPLVDAQWFTGLLNRLSEQQVRQIFSASTDNQKQADAFSDLFIRKLSELRKATGVTQALPPGSELPTALR